MTISIAEMCAVLAQEPVEPLTGPDPLVTHAKMPFAWSAQDEG
jgi:hypothetical protein